MNRLLFFMIIILYGNTVLQAQTIYVDAVKGSDMASGTPTDPISSLEKAIALAGGFAGNEPVNIRLYPGLYVLQHEAVIRTAKQAGDTVSYTIDAVYNPDDTAWAPKKMPVITSISLNNSTTQFRHANGLLVAKNNVHIRGLKFTGNSNPDVDYYYPVSRENDKLEGLYISQCYFTGDKNSTPIQGAIWAHGAGIKADHCIFYGCKNALLLFRSITGFSLTHSIIYGSYEAAVWFGPFVAPFEFSNNIVSHCNYFWLRPENSTPEYVFKNSIISDNSNYLGMYTSKGPVVANENKHTETAIRKTAKIILNEVKTQGLPKDYLNLSPESDGTELKAGIHKR